MRLVVALLVSLPMLAQGSYYEIGLAGNYRKLYLPSETARESFDMTTSFTGSFSYYFAEMAAFEWSYTKGQSERFVPSPTADSRTTYNFDLVGMDLVLTLADRKDPFIPYVKAGVAYFIRKQVTYDFTGQPSDTIELARTFVPNLGFGLKLRLTRTMSFKIGVEAWTSDSLNKEPRWDMAGRAGISWFL